MTSRSTLHAPGSTTVLIAAGGTGGHLFPAIAVAEAMKRSSGDVRITFVGTGREVERQIIDRAGYPLIELHTKPLKGKSLLYKAGSFALILPAIISSMLLIRRLRPALVIGAGGYVSGPFVLAASFTTPTLILEVNLKPGLTTRWLAPFAGCVACSFEESAALFGKKGFHAGHPVRPEFFCLPEAVRRAGALTVLVVGGSQGSRALNRAILDAAPMPDIHLIHQTGQAQYDEVRDAHARKGSDAEVVPFIENMAAAFAAADLIVSRAGASTISEIAAAGKPAVLVPFAAATDNHQELNARAMERGGAAVVVTEREAGSLAVRIDELRRDPGRRVVMGEAARRMANPRAAQEIAERAFRLIRGDRVTGAAGV